MFVLTQSRAKRQRLRPKGKLLRRLGPASHEHATQVAQFILHILRICYRLSQLVAQEKAIELPYVIEQFFYCCFRKTEFCRQTPVGEIPLRAKVRAQDLEDSQTAFALAFLTEPRAGEVHVPLPLRPSPHRKLVPRARN